MASGSALLLGQTAKRLVEQRRLQTAQLTASRVGIDPKIADSRREQLKEAFQRMDKDGNGTISLEEVLDFLKSVNPDVSAVYISEIYESIDTNHDGRVTITEFTSFYLQQVNQLSEALADLRHSIALAKESVSTAEKHLQTATNRSQSQNEYGVPAGSRLKVTVRGAQNLPKGLFSVKSYVDLSFERQNIRTNVVEGTDPRWEEQFEFLAERPDGKLTCTVMRKDVIANDDLVGDCEVTVEELKDQQTKDVWKQLMTGGKAVGSAKVLLGLQLVFDEGKRIRGEIEKAQRELAEDEELEGRLQRELERLGTTPMGMFTSSSFAIRLEQRVLTTFSSLPTARLEVTSLLSVVAASKHGVYSSFPSLSSCFPSYPPSAPV